MMQRLIPCRSLLSSAVLVLIAILGAPAQEKPADVKPLPDLVQLLNKVRDNQTALERLRKDYICVVTQTSIETDDKGSEKKREIEQFEMFYADGKPVMRQISKGGKPFTDDEKQKEEKKVEKRVKKIKEADKKKQDDSDDENSVTLGTFLKVSKLANPRRANYREHEVLVVDFHPNHEANPQTRAEKIAHKISGSVWIDESALQAAKLEARLDEGIKVAGGLLASIKPGTAMVFEQQRINDEVWLPAAAEINYNARIIFSGKRGRILQQYADYRKFHVSSEIKGFSELPAEQPKQ
jgi:hypothetical protein